MDELNFRLVGVNKQTHDIIPVADFAEEEPAQKMMAQLKEQTEDFSFFIVISHSTQKPIEE